MFRTGLLAALALILLFGWTIAAPQHGMWLTALALCLLALPLSALAAHGLALRQRLRLTTLEASGRLHLLLSGVIIRLVLAYVFGLSLSAIVLFRMTGLDSLGWACMVAIIPAVLGASALWRSMASRESVADWREWRQVRAGVLGGGAIVLVLFGLFIVAVGTVPAVERGGPFVSALVEQIFLAGVRWRWLEAFALGEISTLGAWGRVAAVFMAIAGDAGLILGVATLVGALSMPGRAIGLGVTPAGQAAPRPGDLAWASAVWTILTLAIVVNGFSLAEQKLASLEPGRRPVAVFDTAAERIGESLYEPGTLDEVSRLRLEAAADQVAIDTLSSEIDRAFDRIDANVDGFVDWYYTLPAEYLRLGQAFVGNSEAYLHEKLSEFLFAGDPFAGLETLMSDMSEEETARNARVTADIARLLDERRLQLSPDQPVRLMAEAPPELVLALGDDTLADTLARRFQTRLATTAGAGAVAGVMSAVVAKKLLAKGVAKTAAKAVAKMVASKAAASAAGAGTGAAIGGAVGSVVPGVGTAVGAAVGGVIGGVAVSVGVDYLLTELDQALNEDTLRAEIRAALSDARSEMHATLAAAAVRGE